VVTSSRHDAGSTSRMVFRLGKPGTLAGRVGMTTADSTSPNVLLLESGNAACG
jgi:hypothetical protein